MVTDALANDRQVQVCGRRLNQQLDALCSGRYLTITGKKRSDQLQFDNLNLENFNNEPEENTLMLDYIDTALPTGLMGSLRNHRLRRNYLGIVDECCHKPCSLSTMQEFCG